MWRAVGGAQRVADKQVRAWHVGCTQQVHEFVGYRGSGAGKCGCLAPTGTRAVVEDGGRQLGDAVVHVQVVQTDQSGTGQEHHGRAPAPGTVQQQPPPRDLAQPAQRRLQEGRFLRLGDRRLIWHGALSEHRALKFEKGIGCETVRP